MGKIPLYEREILLLVQHSDATGICQASHVLQFFVDSFHLFLKENGGGVSDLLSQGIVPFLTEYEIKHSSPLYVGERYVISIEGGSVLDRRCVLECVMNTLQGTPLVSGILQYTFLHSQGKANEVFGQLKTLLV